MCTIARAQMVRTGVIDELAQHLRRDLLWRKVLTGVVAVDLYVAALVLLHCVRHLRALLLDLVVLAADEALDGEEGVLWVDDALTFCDLQRGAGIRDCDA